jgi:MFS family permease
MAISTEASETDLRVTIGAPPEIDLAEQPAAPVGSRLGADFVRLWSATAVSSIGDGIRIAVFPLLAATITRDPLLVSGVLFATRLPWLFFSLHSGAIIDRVDRRKLMVSVAILRGLVMAALAIALLTGIENLWLLYVAAFLQGTGEVFSDNAAFALLPRVVARYRLEAANSRLEAAVIVLNEFAGPGLGALLFMRATGLPFVVDALTFLVAAGFVWAIRHRTPPPKVATSRTKVSAEIGEGLRWLFRERYLLRLSIIGSLTNFFLHATFAIAVLFVLEILHAGEFGFAALLAIEAGGAFFGALVAGSIRRRLGSTTTIAGALLLAACANLVIAAAGSYLIVVTMAAFISLSGATWNVVTNSMRQQRVPDRLIGRVQSAHRLLSWGAIPLGALAGGLLAGALGLRAPFLIAGLALLALTAAARRLTVPAEQEAAPYAV